MLRNIQNAIRYYILGNILLAILGLVATGDAIAQDSNMQFAAKFVCGKSEGVSVVTGIYESSVSIHNPEYQHVALRYKVAIGLPGGNEGPISPFKNKRIGPDGAIEFSCRDFLEILGPNFPLPPLISGFFVIESLTSLDVFSLLSSTDLSKASVSLELYEVQGKLVPPVKLPDLVVSSLCIWSRHRASATIMNQGIAPAASSTTRIYMTPVSDGGAPTGPTQTVDLLTPNLAPGASAVVETTIPANCYGPNCEVKAESDVLDAVFESLETNNTSGVSTCIG